MNWSECKLGLKSTEMEGKLRLEFIQPIFGLNQSLCTLTKDNDSVIIAKCFDSLPSSISRFIFRWTHGLRKFEPIFGVFCDAKKKNNIRFYASVDRKGFSRVYAEATEPYEDGGGSFLVDQEDFNKVTEELRNLQKSRENKTEMPTAARRSD